MIGIEKPIVNPHFCINAMIFTDPVNNSFNPSSIRLLPIPGLGQVFTSYFCQLTRFIAHHFNAFYYESVA